MKMNRKSLYAVLGLLLTFPAFPFSAMAQRGGTGAYDEKVLVTAPYQPSLGGLDKSLFVPSTLDTVLRSPVMDYQILSRPFSPTYPIDNIKPAKLLGEPIPKLYNNSIRLGFGYPLSPLAELNFGVGRNRKYELGVFYRHHSAFGHLKGYDRFKTDHSLNEAHLTGRIFADKFVSSVELYYGQKAVNCYGLGNAAYADSSIWRNVELEDYADQPRRWYQNARGVVSFTDNARTEDALRFDAKLDYNLNLTNWRSIENSIIVDGGVSKTLLRDRKSADLFSIGGRIRFEDNTYRDGVNDGYWDGIELETYHRGNELMNAYHFQIQPEIHYEYAFVELDAALVFHVFGNAASSYPNVAKQDRFQFNPVVDLKLHIIDKIFTFFIGTGGGVWRNTVESISSINPYLHPLWFSDLKFTRDKFNAYAGLYGNFSKNIDYRVKVSGHFLQDRLHFDYYRYDYSHYYGFYGYNDFIPCYSGDVFQLKVRGDLNFRWGEKLLAHVDAAYNHYDQRLYYAPAFRANVAFKYNLAGNKLSLYTNLMISSSMKALDRMGQEVTLNPKGCYDWSIGAEYRFIDRMTAFANFGNILAQRYYLWNDYQAYRFNFMAGITFDF